MNDVQMASFKIISAVGTAKSYYIEAIRFSENGEFEKAQENMEKGKESYKEGHEVHFKLIQEEAGGGNQDVTVLLVHAEDQLMSTETIQLLAEQMINTNKRLYKLENKYIKYILPILILFSFPSMYKGILDFYAHYNDIAWYRIAGGTYTTKYAAELGIYFLLGIFSIAYYKKIYIKLLLIPYIIINLGLIFLTQSRNTFIAIPLTIIFLYIIVDWKKGIIILLILLGGLGILFKYNHNIANVNRIKSTISTVEKIKVDTRYILFKEGIKRAKNHLLIGEGFYSNKGGKLPLVNENMEHYHNIFIETAVTQGVFTLIVYIIFIITLFIRMLKNYFKEDDRLKRYIKLYALAVFIFSILYGLFEPIFYFEKIYQLIFTIIAISFIIDDNESKIS